MSWRMSFYNDSIRSAVGFFYLYFQLFPQVWEVLSYYFFEQALCTFLLLFSLWNPIILMLHFLIELDISQRISSFLLSLSSLSSSICSISIFLSFKLLILSSILSTLLFRESIFFLFSSIVFTPTFLIGSSL